MLIQFSPMAIRMREIARRTDARGRASLTIDRKKIGMNQKIVFTTKPLKNVIPRRFRRNFFTSLLMDCKELYFSLIRVTVNE